MRQKDCYSWSCQVEAIVGSAADLFVKLEQRRFKTLFRWPEFGDIFDRRLMVDENMEPDVSEAVINLTYMPAALDQDDSENPSAVDGGVWYKARVSLRGSEQVGGCS